MRVLVVTPWFPSSGAPGSGVFNLRDVRLLAEEHEVTVLHLIRPDLLGGEEVEYEDFAVERVPFQFERPGTIRPASQRIRELLPDHDAIHSMAFSALLPVRMARPSVPWAHTEHYSQLVTPPASSRMAVTLGVLKRLFKRPDETIAVSRSLAEVMDGYRKRPTAVIANEVMTPADTVPDTVLDSKRMRVIAVGGIIERKGPIPALETMIELRRRGVDASLTWVGEGDLSARMIELAAQAGVSEHLTLTGHLSPDDLSRELLRADLFLLPVETETFGVAIAEALAHGLPVVTSGTGGHLEFLPSHASRVVADRSPDELGAAVVDIASDPERWTRERIAEFAAARFSHEARREAYREVYGRLAA